MGRRLETGFAPPDGAQYAGRTRIADIAAPLCEDSVFLRDPVNRIHSNGATCHPVPRDVAITR